MNNKLIKRAALDFLKENWVMMVVICMIPLILSGLFQFVYETINTDVLREIDELNNENINITSFDELSAYLDKVALVNDDLVFEWLPTLGEILAGGLAVAVMGSALWVARGNKLTFSTFGSKLRFYLKSLGLYVVKNVLTILGLILLIVPGIMLLLEYSQAEIILSNDPSLSIRQCLKQSRTEMNGKKRDYFNFVLSFFWWLLLEGLVVGGLTDIINLLGVNAVSSILGILVNALGLAIISAYFYVAKCKCYIECISPDEPVHDYGEQRTDNGDVYKDFEF